MTHDAAPLAQRVFHADSHSCRSILLTSVRATPARATGKPAAAILGDLNRLVECRGEVLGCHHIFQNTLGHYFAFIEQEA